MSRDKKPDVYLESGAYERLNLYYKHCTTGEISGLGSVYIDTEGDLVVNDVFLLPQEADPGETEIDAATMGDWLTAMIQDGKDPEGVKLWWHKHPIESWSGVDQTNIDVALKNDSWMLSIVKTPTKFLARLDIYQPFRITMDELRVLEMKYANDELDALIKAEVAAKVKPKVRAIVQTSYTGRDYVYNPATGYMTPAPFETRFKDDDFVPTSRANGSKKNASGRTHDTGEEFFKKLADEGWEDHFHWEDYYQLIP